MPNVDQGAISGPQPDDGVYASATVRRSLRRKQAAVGAVGLVAFIGAGAFVVDLATSGDDQVVTDFDALAPLSVDPTDSPTPSPVPSSASSVGASAAVQKSPRASASPDARHRPATVAPTDSADPDPSTAAEQVKAAREAAAEDGVPLKRPRVHSSSGEPVAVADNVKITQTGSLEKDKRTIKVVSARENLAGQRELAWITDEGERFGDASCSQKIQLANETEPRVRPTLLLCWRTSANKSVYTVTVDISGPPSKTDSVAAIDKEWAAMG